MPAFERRCRCTRNMKCSGERTGRRQPVDAGADEIQHVFGERCLARINAGNCCGCNRALCRRRVERFAVGWCPGTEAGVRCLLQALQCLPVPALLAHQQIAPARRTPARRPPQPPPAGAPHPSAAPGARSAAPNRSGRPPASSRDDQNRWCPTSCAAAPAYPRRGRSRHQWLA